MLNLNLFGRRRVPFVAATELNECGLACLAAISEFHHGEFSISEIRRLAVHSGRGETLFAVRNLAERMGLSARGVRLGLEGLAALAVPAILHWEMNHFVVLERVTRRGILIMDPAAGRMEIPWEQVNRSFTGVALEAKPTTEWRRYTGPRSRVSIWNLIGSPTRWRADIAAIVCLSLLIETLVLLTPLQMRLSIDQALLSGDGRLVWVLGIGFAIVVLLQASFSIVRAWSASVFGTRVGYDLMDRFVRALHSKPADFFLKHHTGDVLNRSRSVDAIQTIVTAQLIQVLIDTAMSIAMVVVMFLAVPMMCLVVVGFGLVNFAVTGVLSHAALENWRRVLRSSARAESLFLENARAARAIRLFGKESVRINVWRNKFVELTNLRLGNERLMLFSAQAAQAANGLGNVALISTGSYLVLMNSISLGTMVMFFVFRAFFVERLNNCLNFLLQLRVVQTHVERISTVVGREEHLESLRENAPFSIAPSVGVSIEARNLWFRYGDDSPWVLKGASFKIEAGESVAIIGASGSGKSTLMGIMLGLLNPVQGEILINGRDLKTIDSADYAPLIGAVLQDDVMFQGTIAENISFFDAPLDMERVIRAAEMANIARDIEAMPMQYRSLLAEAAVDISGGQKQRMFIARAVYHEPKVLFLDEATSHLDVESESLVGRSIKAMRMTRVLIAHRKETIATADRVLLLDSATGRVTAEPVAQI